MGSLSFSTYRGHVHWQGLLLVVSLFHFWCQPTTAEVSIVSTSIAEGEAALLPLQNTPPNVTAYIWYRGQKTDRSHMIAFLITHLRYDIKGPAYSGRERINADGSLLIDNAYINDEGMYTVVVYVADSIKEIGLGRLIVYEPDLIVSLGASNTTVTENKDTVVLTCNTNALTIQWLFNGMNLELNERMKVSKVHQSLTIDPVKREDAGTYQCEVFNPIMSTASFPVVLHVKLSDTRFLP
ncbi:carcinoembryonic antigen-related cell adhesion molecule 21-like [Phyllostomus discolor]|uniref:Carcinoembryonic antigen-related cell adhesion molecule 21-like n=1 Tax=Phyllostomus discolor TaxID=89673 RepID=A0A7E6CPL0_9CHIR|nr:carcinoembryonic antigen-related cell adhesion molecule 21-like [Phyllostomus discolor]